MPQTSHAPPDIPLAPTPGISPVIDYVSAPPPRNADRRLVFKYLLPAGVCLSTLLGSAIIEIHYPDGDSRNFAGPLLIMMTGPLAITFGIFAIGEIRRANGFRALLWGLAWNIALVVTPVTTLWLIVKLGVLKQL